MPNIRTPIYKQILGAVTGIAAGAGNVKVTIPPGATYDDLFLYCTIAGTAATLAQMSTMLLGMRWTIGGREIGACTALQCISVREFYQAGSAGYLKLPAAQYLNTIPAEQTGFDIGTKDENSFEISIATDGTNTIDAIGVIGVIRPVAEPLGVHSRWASISPSLSIGTQQTTLPWSGSPEESLLALHFFVPTIANFTTVSIISDNERIVDASTPWTYIEEIQKSGPIPRISQSGTYKMRSIDFRRSGLVGDALQLNMSLLQAETTFASANPGAVTMLAEIATTK